MKLPRFERGFTQVPLDKISDQNNIRTIFSDFLILDVQVCHETGQC